MTKVRSNIAISLDGYAAGPNQTEEQGLGEGGEQLHEWAFQLRVFNEIHGREGGEINESDAVLRETFTNVGARVMGRNMFGAALGRGTRMTPGTDGGATSPLSARRSTCSRTTSASRSSSRTAPSSTSSPTGSSLHSQARATAGEEDIHLPGGAETINEYLVAGEVDELLLHVVPVLLGDGARLFEGVGPDVALEQLQAVEAPGVTHVKYRVG